MLLRSMQNTPKELADAKAAPMLCVMMLPLVVVGCTSSSLSVSVKATTPPAWIMQPPRLADTAERGLFHPVREADHYANNWKEPRSILMSSVDRVAHIDGQLMQLL